MTVSVVICAAVQLTDDGVEVLGVDGEPRLDAAPARSSTVRSATPGGDAEARGRSTVTAWTWVLVCRRRSARLPELHGASLADDGDPVGKGLDLVEDVAGQQDRDALLAPLAHALPEASAP